MKPTHAHLGTAILLFFSACAASAQILISGNENKIDLDPGAATVVPDARPDSLSIIDFSSFPPKIGNIENVSNTVLGPPSNIAITPDGKLALVADSVKIDPASPTGYLPNDEIHLLDLTTSPPRLIGKVRAGEQPSGISISGDGKLALAVNRAAGTVSVLRIDGKSVSHLGEVKVAEPASSASDVAISPDGKRALVSVQKTSVLVELKIEGEKVAATGRQFGVYGQPYRVVISPDGRFAITAGAGFGSPGDLDAVSVIDLAAAPAHTIQHLTTGSSPESVEISPDGKLLAVVTMNGSNLATGDPARTQHGGLSIYRRTEDGFEPAQTLETGRIPEGVAFTGDGKYLVVQCHPERELRIYSVGNGKVEDTGERVKLPGMPSSLRAARK